MSVKRVATILAIVAGIAGAAMAETEWTDHPDNPVIGTGEPGEWTRGATGSTVVFAG